MVSIFRILVGVSVIATAALAAAPSAHASVTVVWTPSVGSTGNTGATAKGVFSFSQSSLGVVELDLDVFNTTNGSVGLGATQATLVGVAFDMPTGTTVKSYDHKTTSFTKLWTPPHSASLPPYGSFDIGISPPRNTFAGGNPTTGVTAGNSMLVSFLLNTQTSATNLEKAFDQLLDDEKSAVARFQVVNKGGSDKVLGAEMAEPVPELSTWAMMIIGFGGVALRLRRRAAALQTA